MRVRRNRKQPVVLVSVSPRRLVGWLIPLVIIYVCLLWNLTSNPHSMKVSSDKNIRTVSRSNLEDLSDEFVIRSNEPVRIGVASTITSCGPESAVAEGAAVLQYSIQLTSHQGSKGGRYAYDFYILYHPEAKECALPLADLGFSLLETPTPVALEEIREGSILRERISNNGCCGEKELIKLEAFRLTQYPIVIHFDLDVLVFQPMDPVLDFLLNPSMYQQSPNPPPGVPLMWPDREIPNEISLIYTTDFNMVAPKRKDKPIQGGFFMVRPSLEIYNDFLSVVREADYRDGPNGTGWGGQVGPFHGGMTIQGLLPWYFQHLHPGRAVELNRCIYNSMADNPTIGKSVNGMAVGLCRTNQEVSDWNLSKEETMR